MKQKTLNFRHEINNRNLKSKILAPVKYSASESGIEKACLKQAQLPLKLKNM